MKNESALKRYLKRKCGSRGWECIALENKIGNGWPDRTILVPVFYLSIGHPYTAFLEIKDGRPAKSKHLTEQVLTLLKLRSMGYYADLAIDKNEISISLDYIEVLSSNPKREPVYFSDIQQYL